MRGDFVSEKTIKINQKIAAIITIVLAALNLINGINLVIKGNSLANNPILTGQGFNSAAIFGSLGKEFAEIGIIGIIGAVIIIILMAFYLYKRSVNLGYLNVGVLTLLPLLGLIVPAIAPAAPLIYIVLGIYLGIFVYLEVKNTKTEVPNQPVMINHQVVQPQVTPVSNPTPVTNPAVVTPPTNPLMNQPVDIKPKQLDNNQPQKPLTNHPVNNQSQPDRPTMAPTSTNQQE